jgi:DNA-binding CsgD family transcriptional regulator/tetratricopeptide (TPR) repeat protein
VPVSWPLVGRDEELELIEQAFDRPGTAGVVLAGEAGVGKTRLAREALALAQRRGMATAWGAATEAASSIPFGAITHLFPRSVSPAMNPQDVIRGAAVALLERAGGGHLVLGIDDAHLLDDLTAVLVHDLAQGEGASVVATVRTGEVPPDPVTSLWKDGLCDRFEVQALSELDVGVLLDQALAGSVERATIHRFFEQTRGNPLFLRELVLGELDVGSLSKAEGMWRWTGGVGVRPRVQDVIGARLAHLTSVERDALEIAAMAEPIGIQVLESLVSAGALDTLESAGLLTESVDQRRIEVRLAHPLYAETLRASMPPARARSVRGKLAEALEATGARRRDDLLRISTWSLDARRGVDAGALLTAAGQALGLCDFPLADRLAHAADEGGAGPQAKYVRAHALMGQARFADADALLAEAEAEATAEADRAAAATARAHNLVWSMDQQDRALRHLEDVEATLSDLDTRDEVRAVRANFLLLAGRAEDAITEARAILARPRPPAVVVLNAVYALGVALSEGGRPEEALALWDQWSDWALTAKDRVPTAPIVRPLYLKAALSMAGRLKEAQEVAESAYEEALGQAMWVVGFLASLAGSAAIDQGHPRTAERWLREAVGQVRGTNVLGQLSFASSMLAHALALAGDVEAAENALGDALAARHSANRIDEAFIGGARVWLAAARGEAAQARSIALEEADALAAMGFKGFECVLLHDAARLGGATDVAERLTNLAKDCDGLLIPAFVRHVRALVANDGPALEQVSRDFEKMGADLFAAEAAAEASCVYRDLGKTGSAFAARARAKALADLCEGARTPALEGIEEPLPLTRREKEVAILAARGLSNKDVAQRLSVSVRTVENQLHTTYAKLGITRRDELRAILDPSTRSSTGQAPHPEFR